jgi:hypothetical protein
LNSASESCNSNGINEKITYWIDLWNDLIKRFSDNIIGIRIMNPHSLLIELIDEIDSNNLQNSENKKYYFDKLNEYLKSDQVIRKYYKVEFELLRSYYDQNKYLLKQACKKIKASFENGDYYLKSHNSLKKILLDRQWRTGDEYNIRLLTQHIIIELLIKGYHLNHIENFVSEIFDSYSHHLINENEEVVFTKFPVKARRTDYKNDIEFNESMMKEIDNLTFEERIDTLKQYFFKEPESWVIIYKVEGLKGDIDFSLGDVNFYSPNVKRYITVGTELELNEELFHKTDLPYYLNAAVTVQAFSQNLISEIATQKIEKAFDILRVAFTSENGFEIMHGNYLVVKNGKRIKYSASMSKKNGLLRWASALHIEESNLNQSILSLLNKVVDYSFSEQENQSLIEKRITHSLRYFRKAEDAQTAEEKIVNYWICIENLLDFQVSFEELLNKKKETKFSLAQKFIPNLFVNEYIYHYGNNFYCNLLNKVNFDGLELPADVLKDCSLLSFSSKDMSLISFLENLGLLTNHIHSKLLKEKLIEVSHFYFQNNVTISKLEEKIKEIETDLLLLYRYRNKIVHNAHFDHSMLSYFTHKARYIAHNVLFKLLYKYNGSREESLESVFINYLVETETILKNLKENRNTTVLSILKSLIN